MSDECNRVVFVEYRNGRPFTVIAQDADGHRDHHDFEWCKRDECLYRNMSGSGDFGPAEIRPGTEFWAAPDFPLKTPELGKRLARPKRGFPIKTLMDDTCESDCVYCSACDDHLPGSDTDSPCDHIWWCNDAAWWSTPEERCPLGCLDCLENRRGPGPLGDPMAAVAEGYAVGFLDRHRDQDEGWHEDRVVRTLARGYGRAARAYFEEVPDVRP